MRVPLVQMLFVKFKLGHKIWEIYLHFLDMWLFWHGVIQDGVILAWGYFDMGLFRMGLFWHRVIFTRGYLGWGYFGLGLFWHGVILVWGYFGLGLFWFGVIMVWGYFGGVISVGLFWFGVISYCSRQELFNAKICKHSESLWLDIFPASLLTFSFFSTNNFRK